MLNNGVSRSGANVLLEVLGHHADNRLILQDTQIRQNYVARQERPVKSVILITVDALRPDRMSLYGAPRVTTPYLQQMQAQGLAHPVREARSACPESTCGLLSLLSGKEPHILLANNFGLPEILGRLGYQRYFLLSGDHSNYYGLKESYGEHEVYWDGTSVQGYANDDFQLLKQLEIMPQALQDQRYFFFIHLMSVHGLGRRNERFLQWYPYQSIYHPSSSLSFGSDFAPYYNYYDNGILQADFLVHRIFNLLKTKNYIDDSSIVLLTADHGESLGEHGVKSHAESLYDSVIRIPWVWLGPRPIGHTESPVIQADFAPTVLQELGAPIPPHWSGLPLQQGSSQRLHTYHAQLPLAAVVEYGQNTKKLIFDFHSQEKLFFNLSHDPKEMYPLQDMDFGMADKLNNAGFSFFSYAQ